MTLISRQQLFEYPNFTSLTSNLRSHCNLPPVTGITQHSAVLARKASSPSENSIWVNAWKIDQRDDVCMLYCSYGLMAF